MRLSIALIACCCTLLLIIQHCDAMMTPNFKQFPDCDYTPLVNGNNALPKFAPEFEIRTEVKWADTFDSTYTVSFESTGYYQLNGSRGATIITREGSETRFLYDFQSGRAFNIYSPRHYYCSPVQNLYESACSPFAYYVAEEAGFEFIQDKCSIRATQVTQVKPLNATGAELPVVVRGIPVYKYKQCVWMAAQPGDAPTSASSGSGQTTATPAAGTDSTGGSYWLMEYYYSKNESLVQAGARLQGQSVPVRLNTTRLVPGVDSVNGTKPVARGGVNAERSTSGHKPRQLYDFFFYRTNITDKTVFDPPAGVNCRDWQQAGNRSLPRLPDQFSLATISVTSSNKSDIAHTRLSFDNKKKIVLFLTDSNDRWIYPRRAARIIGDMHTIVQDFNSGLSFDMTYNQCSEVKAISKFAQDVRKDPRDPQSISMVQANEFFAAGDLDFTYMGTRLLNDAPAHVWIATKNATGIDERFGRTPERSNVELLFYETPDPNARSGIAASISSSGQNIMSAQPSSPPGSTKFVPAAIILYRFTNLYGQLQEKTTSTVNFYSEDPIFWKTFDISECLTNSSIVQDDAVIVSMVLRETTHDNSVRMPLMIGFQNALQDGIARMMAVSALRVSDLLLEPLSTNGSLKIWFTVLGWPHLRGDVFSPRSQVSPQDALKRLNATLSASNNYMLALNWTTWNESFIVVKNSLRVVNATTIPSNGFEPGMIPMLSPGMMDGMGSGPGMDGKPGSAMPVDATTIYSGYTGGAMAGLAIAMLIIGAIGGIVGGFLLWKRQTGIAYQIYD